MSDIPEHAYLNASGVYNGVEENVLLNNYGKPEHEFIKPRYKLVGEYYIEIENIYRSTNPEFKNIPIKEMFWHLRQDLNLTCFFHYKDGQWRVIFFFFLSPGAKF
ncbi:hypothetical protein AC26_0277 [Escherichia coli 1-176-05_S3_C2]|uniref:hypothetical protein n=1 Tax=Escherichia coli TaxID=562 RepID=UPI00044978DA|nr:hypothetical protein AC26_0277 [Escherichia coli 1-176-05_S3_C2]